MKTRFSLAIAVLCIAIFAFIGLVSAGAAAIEGVPPGVEYDENVEGCYFDDIFVPHGVGFNEDDDGNLLCWVHADPGVPEGGIPDEDDGGYTLWVQTYICPSGNTGGWSFPNCAPWDVTVTMLSDDGTVLATCMGACGNWAPYSARITVSVDAAAVPEGYYLMYEPVQVWTNPDGPPAGGFNGGMYFIVYPLGYTYGEEWEPEVQIEEPGMDDTTDADDTGDSVTAETTDTQGVEGVSLLPNTGTKPIASGATGMDNLLIAVAVSLMAGACGLRRGTG